MTNKEYFLEIARELNRKLHIVPLLYGSLGLGQRLQRDLRPDDIDILVPESFLTTSWDSLVALMSASGYVLYDLHEHAFVRDGLSVAFAGLEDLFPFAGVDPALIPEIQESGVHYLLPELTDWLRVYSASQKDGYRQNTREKDDAGKIRLIRQALERSGG